VFVRCIECCGIVTGLSQKGLLFVHPKIPKPENKVPLWGAADLPPEGGVRYGKGRVEIREGVGGGGIEGGVVQTKV